MTISFDIKGNGEVHLDVLKAICGNVDDKSMADLCCGFAPQTRQLGFKHRFYVDSVSRDLGSENLYFFNTDVLDFLKSTPLKFNTCILLDAIEHFRKDEAKNILNWMEAKSSCQIIFTPLGDYLIEKKPTNNPDSHKSGWLPSEFEKMGWNTVVFPNFHKLLGIGAFFAFKGNDNNFDTVKEKLNKLNLTKWRNH